jgi:hypothetical protein
MKSADAHMISVGFQRVSKKRPCRICGKPTYCGFSRDEGTSICMRISAGSRGLSRNGGNIHVHSEIPFITIRPIKRSISQSVPLAALEIRDAVFQKLIRISPASNYIGGTCRRPGRVAVTRTARGARHQLRSATSNKTGTRESSSGS